MKMSNSKTGRTVLRPLPGQRASGVCLHSVRDGRLEATVAAQAPVRGAVLTALLQYGPMGGYRCLPAEPVEGMLQASGPLPMAVWVLDRGNPVLFGQLTHGDFDMDVAKSRLLQPAEEPPAPQAVEPLPLAPEAQEESIPEEVVQEEIAPEEVALEEPAPEDALGYDTPAQPAALEAPAETLWMEEPLPPEGSFPAVAPPEEVDHYPVAVERPTPPPPLVIQRAPRPGPLPPVYSPLWDDVSAEFERMLEALPLARPFHSRGDDDAQFAELPLGGAVQCYIGSVVVEGKHVFLQAVPSRPYGRPAGFDHTLLSRDGTCYWVKYFIEE